MIRTKTSKSHRTIIGLVVVSLMLPMVLFGTRTARAQQNLFRAGDFQCTIVSNPFGGSHDYQTWVFPPQVRAVDQSHPWVYWRQYVREWTPDRTDPDGGRWRWRGDLHSEWMYAKASSSAGPGDVQFFEYSTRQPIDHIYRRYRATYQAAGSYWAFYNVLWFQQADGTWMKRTYWSENNTQYPNNRNRWFCPEKPWTLGG